MGRPIPEIRARLLELAKETGIDELRELAEETRRRSPVRRAPYQRRTKFTEDEQREIRDFVENNPELDYSAVAQRFSTNIGRISEIIAGKLV